MGESVLFKLVSQGAELAAKCLNLFDCGGRSLGGWGPPLISVVAAAMARRRSSRTRSVMGVGWSELGLCGAPRWREAAREIWTRASVSVRG